MKDLQFLSSVAAAAKGADSIFLISAAAHVRPKLFDLVLGKGVARVAKELAVGLEPGVHGASAESLVLGVRGAPRRVSIGVLPNSVSHHNSPTRAEALRRTFAGMRPAKGKKTAVVLVLDDPAHAQACATAIARCLPLFQMRGKKTATAQIQLTLVDPDAKSIRWTALTRDTAEGVREAARLVDTPPTDMNPEALAREAKALLRGIKGVRTQVIVGPDLLKKKLGGIHAVGRTALKAPRMLVATAGPANARKHIALVGKGVTYDTGGLNIKTGGHMAGMKCDMGGSAAVLGAFRALAKSNPKKRLSLVMCLAENAIGPSAYKPDDVLKMHSGKTVEINNTDAEGRILLADGVSYAARVLKADVIFDAATLTGAQLVATGNLHAAVVSNDAKLESHVVEAGRASGDLTHPLPFAPEFYQEEFASQIADMRNSVKNRMNAQASCAAQFVFSHLEGTKARWCHIDLAGPATMGGRGTGFGVSLLVEAVTRL